MTDTCTRLVACMVVAVIAGEHERVYELYDEFVKENRLYVTVREILEAKEASA
mgnify:FL=1